MRLASLMPPSIILSLGLAVPAGVFAQTPKPPASPPAPTQVISTAAVQPWQYRQEWHCSNTPTVGQEAIARLGEVTAALGNDGWEFVAFSPVINVSQQGECFFAIFKRPAPR